MRPPVGAPTLSRRTRILLIVAAVIILLLLGGSRLLDLYVDWLWFGEVGYRSVFSTVLVTHVLLFVIGGLVMGGLVALSLWIAYRSRPVFVPVSGPEDPVARYRTVIIQRLRLFGIGIPVVIGLIAGPRRAGRLGDRPDVPQLHGVRRHRPGVRHRRRLLRVRAAVLPVGAGPAVRRGGVQLRGRAGRPLRVRRHPAGRPGGPAERRGAHPAGRAGRACSCCSRPSRTGWTGTSCCSPTAAKPTSPAPATPTSTRCCRPS